MNFAQPWEDGQAFHKEQWQIMHCFPLYALEEEAADCLLCMFWFTYHVRCEKEYGKHPCFSNLMCFTRVQQWVKIFPSPKRSSSLYEHIELFQPLFIVQPIICYMNWNSFCSADLLYLLRAWWRQDYLFKSVSHGLMSPIAEEQSHCCWDDTWLLRYLKGHI